MTTQLGTRISGLLLEQGRTQKYLANRLNVTEAVISRYISGERQPKPDMLANIATALNTTSDYLLGIEKDEFSHSKVKRMLARNAKDMTNKEKNELITALLGEE